MVQVKNARGKTYPACYNTVVADGKPHERFEVTLDAEADIAPMMLIAPLGVAATTWDLNPVSSANQLWAQADLAITEIPNDFPGRDMFSTAVYAASQKGVPAVPVEISREYYLKTATDMTGYNEGQLLIPAANGDLAKATDESPDALTTVAHAFKLMYAVSTTQIVVKYLGLLAADMA